MEVGGAGVGYYVAKDERSTGVIIDDAAITTAIKAKFLKKLFKLIKL